MVISVKSDSGPYPSMNQSITHNHLLLYFEVKIKLSIPPSKPALFLAYVDDIPGLSVAQTSNV